MDFVKTWKVTLSALVLPVVMPMIANAENLLGVAPLRTVLSDKRPSDIINLTNRSEQKHTYKVVLQDQVMQENGDVVYKEDFPYSAKRLVRFMPRVITLQPGERQNLRVMMMPPADLPEGEYHAHLVFDEVPDSYGAPSGGPENTLRINMRNMYSVGLPIIVQHGKISSALKLESAKLVKTKETLPAVALTLLRTGNGEATGMLKVIANDGKGESVVSEKNMHMYREVDKVTLNMMFKGNKAPPKGTKLTATMEQDGKVVDKVDVTN
jgi:fimbrial chaperone protein